jgi:cellobiose transport system permease protein
MTQQRTRSRFELTYKQRQTLGRLDFKLSPYLYISPFFILFALIGIFPLAYTVYVSMFKWPLLQGQGAFNFPENYIKVLTDDFFWNSIFNTFSIFVISIVPQVVMALIIAGFLDQNIRAKTFWRMSVFLPFIVSPVAVALIFTNMFSEHYGLVNNLLSQFGLDPVAWKTSVFPSHFAIATMVNWRWTGYNTLVLLAAMQAVPRDIYEAAEIDGAGPIRRYFSVTLPSIRPTVLFVIITATIGGMQIFAEPRLYNDPQSVNPGGAFRQFETAVLYIWDMAFLRQDFGRASAIAILLFFLIVSVALVNFVIATRIATSGDPRPFRPRRPLVGIKPFPKRGQ